MTAPPVSSSLQYPVEQAATAQPAVTSIGVCRELALALLLLAFASAPASAAALNLQLADSAGRPLGDAVALVEPSAGAPKVVVRPMADVAIAQAKRQFEPRVTVITVGTKASFPNFDTVRHHVYSFSAVKAFELKLYAGVPHVPLTFDKAGIAVLGCNIHDSMAAWVVIADTPWFGRSDVNGRVRIDNLPAGAYQLRLWHPGMTPGTEPLPTPLVIAANGETEHRAKLNVVALEP